MGETPSKTMRAHLAVLAIEIFDIVNSTSKVQDLIEGSDAVL